MANLNPVEKTSLAIPRAKLLELSKLGPLGAIGDILLEWAFIIGAAWLCNRHFHPALYLLAIIWIGSRQHSLGTIMHDGSHWRAHNSRTVNDFITEFFCAWPLFFRMEAYRYWHLQHHQHTGTDKDPDYTRDRHPTSRKEILIQMVLDAFSLNAIKQMKVGKRIESAPVTKKTQVLRVLYYTTVFTLITLLGGWKVYLLYWVVPMATFMRLALNVRQMADHAGLGKTTEEGLIRTTRTLVPNALERILFFPRNTSYHLGHHLYMSVPSKNLAKLHDELEKYEIYRVEGRRTQGFIGMLNEFPWEERKSS